IETALKPFKVLYNLEDPAISFIVLSADSFNGFALSADDKVKVADTYSIDLKSIKILYLVRIIKKDDALEMTANLRAPIVIDGDSKLAWQHILESTEFQFDFPLKGLFATLHKHKDD
ncbi:MAG: flagellar assembly protein FliW, partial [Candidatus Nucleicultricaceae bacterium]